MTPPRIKTILLHPRWRQHRVYLHWKSSRRESKAVSTYGRWATLPVLGRDSPAAAREGSLSTWAAVDVAIGCAVDPVLAADRLDLNDHDAHRDDDDGSEDSELHGK